MLHVREVASAACYWSGASLQVTTSLNRLLHPWISKLHYMACLHVYGVCIAGTNVKGMRRRKATCQQSIEATLPFMITRSPGYFFTHRLQQIDLLYWVQHQTISDMALTQSLLGCLNPLLLQWIAGVLQTMEALRWKHFSYHRNQGISLDLV